MRAQKFLFEFCYLENDVRTKKYKVVTREGARSIFDRQKKNGCWRMEEIDPHTVKMADLHNLTLDEFMELM